MNKKTMPRVWMTLFAVMMVCASLFLAPADAHAAAAPKKITLAAKKQTLSVGSKNFTLKVKKVSPAKASKKVTYKSSDPSVAAVNKNNGKVTAKKVGTAKITVTSKANKKAKAVCTITVVNGVTGIQTANKVTLQVKKKMTLNVGVVPATASKKMLYTTSNAKVAKVNKKGVITAGKKAGKAKITVMSADYGAKKVVTVNVKKSVALVKSVKLDKASVTLTAKGQTAALKATVAPGKAPGKAVYWVSSNNDVATVDAKGKVTAVANGAAKITAYASDSSKKSASCTVTVAIPAPPKPPVVTTIPVTGVTLDKAALELNTTDHKTEKLVATVNPDNATNKNVTWASSDVSVASVAADGTVTAVAEGTATITVKTVDGGKTAACAVTVTGEEAEVTGKEPTEVKVTPDKVTLKVNATEQLQAEVTPVDAVKDVTWSSSDEAVATVSESGLVTAKAKGKATIKATAKAGGAFGECEVTVIEEGEEPDPETEIELSKTALELKATQEETLTATVTPEGAKVTWSTSNEDVAVVTNGKVRAIAVGTATITAATEDGAEAECAVTVTSNSAYVSGGSRHTYELDKAAEMYEATYDGNTVSVSRTDIEEDMKQYADKLKNGNWNDPHFFKTNWNKITAENLEQSFVFNKLLGFAAIQNVKYDVVINDANHLTVTVTKGATKKVVTVEREDLAVGCNFTVAYNGKTVKFVDVKTEKSATNEVKITAKYGSDNLELKLTESKVSLSDNGQDVAAAESTDTKYIGWINDAYYNRLMQKLNLSIDPEKDVVVSNIYVPEN